MMINISHFIQIKLRHSANSSIVLIVSHIEALVAIGALNQNNMTID